LRGRLKTKNKEVVKEEVRFRESTKASGAIAKANRNPRSRKPHLASTPRTKTKRKKIKEGLGRVGNRFELCGRRWGKAATYSQHRRDGERGKPKKALARGRNAGPASIKGGGKARGIQSKKTAVTRQGRGREATGLRQKEKTEGNEKASQKTWPLARRRQGDQRNDLQPLLL